jgi:hypothetical protein
MSRPERRKCRSCPAMVIDLIHERTGKRAPIEVEYSAKGNIEIDLLEGTYRVVAGQALERARASGRELRLNHFASCGAAREWRPR